MLERNVVIMKILLIDPHYVLYGTTVSIGILVVAKVCKNEGWNVYIQENVDSNINIEQKCSDILKKISEYQPDMIGITTRCDTYPFVLFMVEKIKKDHRNIIVMLGGPQATHTDIQSLKICKEIDLIIRGEGEITTAEVLRAIEDKKDFHDILGITYRNESGEIIANPSRPLTCDINYMLDFEVAPKTYIECLKKMKECDIEVGRGCPYSCTYCCTSSMWERRFRLRDAKNLCDEMEQIYYHYGIKHFSFIHDNIMAGRDFKDFLRVLIENNTKEFTWTCSARIDNFDISLLPFLEKAGCKGIYCGIETGSEQMQLKYKKNINITLAKEKLKYILENSDISLTLSFICGHPKETMDDIKKSLEFILFFAQYKKCENIQMHKLAPINGSSLYTEYEKDLVYTGYVSDQAHDELMEKYFEDYIKKYPEIFSSYFDFKHTIVPGVVIYKICYSWSILCKSYPRTIQTIIYSTGMDLIELLLYFDKEGLTFETIDSLFDKDRYVRPNLLFDYLRFESELIRFRESESIPSGFKAKKGVTNNLEVKLVRFNPDLVYTAKQLCENESISNIFKVLIWKGKSHVLHYKLMTDLDNLILFSNVEIAVYQKSKYLKRYLEEMIASELISI